MMPRGAVTRVGLMADLHAADVAAAAASFTAAAREHGLQVVPLLIRPESLERMAPLLSEGYQLDALAALQVVELSGARGALVEVWSKNAVRLGTVITRAPPSPEERARARADVEYARLQLSVDGSRQFQGHSRRPLSRDEFYGLVGRGDLARREHGTSLARGILIGTGVTVGSVGLVLEVLQIMFGALVAPLDVAGCEIDRGINRNSYGPPEMKSCRGPELSHLPLVMAIGGGVLAAGGAAIRSDAASPEEREELARAYNVRLRESLIGPRQAGSSSAASPATALRLSAGAVPEGGMLLLSGRF